MGLRSKKKSLAMFLDRTRDEWARRLALKTGLAGPARSDVEFATELGLKNYTHKRSGSRSWLGDDILALANMSCERKSGRFSMAEVFDRLLPLKEPERAVYWRMGVPTRGRPNTRPAQLAADSALRGKPVKEVLGEAVIGIAQVANEAYRNMRDAFLMESETEESRRQVAVGLVHSALSHGLVELLPVECEKGGFEAENRELARELRERLEADLGSRNFSCPKILVVNRIADSSFGPVDPLSARLIALRAHLEVADYLQRHSDASNIGVMGGILCAQFCRAVGESSPFPDASILDARRYHVFPLTIEPFDLQEELANSLAGELTARARALLGRRRVVGHSVHGFDLLINRQLSSGLRPGVQLRQQFQSLDVALIGCGALRRGGWLDRAMLQLAGGELPAEAIADVGLNLLDIEGDPVALPSPDGHRWELLGISVPELRFLVRQGRKVVLMTHGRVKGLPLVVAARAGVCSTIITDADCARGALDVLDMPQETPAADIHAALAQWPPPSGFTPS